MPADDGGILGGAGGDEDGCGEGGGGTVHGCFLRGNARPILYDAVHGGRGHHARARSGRRGRGRDPGDLRAPRAGGTRVVRGDRAGGGRDGGAHGGGARAFAAVARRRARGRG